MEPHTRVGPAGQVTISQVQVGMAVVDAAGDDVGTVSAVQPPDTDVRPDLAAADAEHLMSVGYLRINGSGALATDVYVGGHQVTDVAAGPDGPVTLAITRDTLHRATS